jgi:hypothetical protein
VIAEEIKVDIKDSKVRENDNKEELAFIAASKF